MSSYDDDYRRALRAEAERDSLVLALRDALACYHGTDGYSRPVSTARYLELCRLAGVEAEHAEGAGECPGCGRSVAWCKCPPGCSCSTCRP